MLALTASRSVARTLVSRTCPAVATTTTTISKRSYHENIVEHYENPRNVGSLDKDDSDVGTVSIRLSDLAKAAAVHTLL